MLSSENTLAGVPIARQTCYHKANIPVTWGSHLPSNEDLALWIWPIIFCHQYTGHRGHRGAGDFSERRNPDRGSVPFCSQQNGVGSHTHFGLQMIFIPRCGVSRNHLGGRRAEESLVPGAGAPGEGNLALKHVKWNVKLFFGE